MYVSRISSKKNHLMKNDIHFPHGYKSSSRSLSGCPLNAQAIKKVKVSEELMTIKLKATGGKSPSQSRSRHWIPLTSLNKSIHCIKAYFQW